MTERISISEFKRIIDIANTNYPNATIMSIGHGNCDGYWYYALFLMVDGEEIRYEIPMYKHDLEVCNVEFNT